MIEDLEAEAEWFPVSAVAKELHCSDTSIHRYIREGRLPFIYGPNPAPGPPMYKLVSLTLVERILSATVARGPKRGNPRAQWQKLVVYLNRRRGQVVLTLPFVRELVGTASDLGRLENWSLTFGGGGAAAKAIAKTSYCVTQINLEHDTESDRDIVKKVILQRTR